VLFEQQAQGLLEVSQLGQQIGGVLGVPMPRNPTIPTFSAMVCPYH
jgi:hypothetical protein